MCGFVLYDTQLIIEKRRVGDKVNIVYITIFKIELFYKVHMIKSNYIN